MNQILVMPNNTSIPKVIYVPWSGSKKAPTGNWSVAIVDFSDINSSVASKVSAVLDSLSFTLSDMKGENWEKVFSLVSAIFDSAIQITKQKKQTILELLKDNHGTFSLFEKSLQKASVESRKWKKITVDLYISDLSDPDFLRILTDNWKGINPKLLVIGINSDDCGLLDSQAINNIRSITKMGFRYSLADFVMDGDELKADNLQKLTREWLNPSYIKIAKSIYERIMKWTIKIWGTIRKLYDSLKTRGIRILLWNETEEGEMRDVTKDIELWFLQKSTIQPEDILTLDWQIYAQEWLVRFWDSVGVIDGLTRLQIYGITGLLTDKIIEATIPVILSGQRRTINIFLKELWENNFWQKIQELITKIPEIQERKGLVFEILEVKYGTLNKKAIQNIRFLQESGFSIAIDDLCVCGSKDKMSLGIFDILNEEWIIPDYLKIEGHYCEAILDGTIPDDHLHYLREIVWHCSLFPRKPIFILEWIQDTDHAIQVKRALSMIDETRSYDVEFLYQGRNIKHWSFGVSMIDKNPSR